MQRNVTLTPLLTFSVNDPSALVDEKLTDFDASFIDCTTTPGNGSPLSLSVTVPLIISGAAVMTAIPNRVDINRVM